MGEAFADGPRCTLMAEQERREAEPRGEAAVAAGHPHNMQGSKELGLTILDEEDNETLLIHNITFEDIYIKQEETIISWRDHEAATELALCFQEAT